MIEQPFLGTLNGLPWRQRNSIERCSFLNREWALTDTCPQHRLCVNTAVSSPSFSRLGFRGGLLPGKARISVALAPTTLDRVALALLNREQNAGQDAAHHSELS
eukprot:COSAG02_NODE_2_length_75708_cov_87.013953_49_plen_104_part_00